MRKTLNHAVMGCIWMLLSLIGGSAHAGQIDVQLLVYQVKEPEADPYISRLLVSADYLRLDQGEADAGFILLDRRARVIYNVNADDELILVIEPKDAAGEIPARLQPSERRVEVRGMPKVAGRQPQHWEFLAQDTLCRSAVVLPGVMPGATQAYAEYLGLLAGQQQANLASIPAEFQAPCDLLIHVYGSDAVLAKGLPLREWEEGGRQQELVDFRQVFPVAEGVFRLPEAYRRMQLGDI